MPEDSHSTPLIERLLAYASLSIIAVALLSFFATLIVGLGNRQAMAQGLWPFVYGVSLFGLPVGFALLITLLIVNARRRGRESAQKAKR